VWFAYNFTFWITAMVVGAIVLIFGWFGRFEPDTGTLLLTLFILLAGGAIWYVKRGGGR
jgi:hypothetical protein